MAADTAHLIEAYSRMAKVHILPRLNALMLTNRSYEGDARNASKVFVTTDTRPGGSVTDIGRTGDWPTAVEIGTVQDEIDIDQDPATASRLDWLDAYDVPLPMVSRAAYWNARRLAEYVDADIYSVMLAGTDASRKETVGTAANYIATNGKASTPAARDLVVGALRDLQTELQIANLMDTGEMMFNWRVDMPPALIRQIDDWLLDEAQEIPRDRKLDIIQSSGINNLNYRYSIFGFDIYVTNNIPTVEISSKTHAQMIICNQRATTLAMAMPLQQVFTPQENQVDAKAGWLFRERLHYGRKVIDDRFIYTKQVRTEA